MTKTILNFIDKKNLIDEFNNLSLYEKLACVIIEGDGVDTEAQEQCGCKYEKTTDGSTVMSIYFCATFKPKDEESFDKVHYLLELVSNSFDILQNQQED